MWEAFLESGEEEEEENIERWDEYRYRGRRRKTKIDIRHQRRATRHKRTD